MKKKPVIIACIVITLLLGLCGVGTSLTLGYFGIIPSISRMLKTDQPRDLGISITEEAREYNLKVLGETTQYTSEGIDTDIQYIGKTDRNITLTSEQLTTLANDVNWKYDPISNLQIKLSDDGKVEGSGMLHVDKIREYVSKTGGDVKMVNEVIEKFNLSGRSFPFYVQLTISADNNVVQWEAQKVEVGRIGIPISSIEPYKDVIDEVISNKLQTIPNLYIEKIEIGENSGTFIGTTPEYQIIHK